MGDQWGGNRGRQTYGRRHWERNDERQPLGGGGRNKFGSTSSHPQQRGGGGQSNNSSSHPQQRGGGGQFSNSSFHPQQRGGGPVGHAGRFNQSTSGPRSIAGDEGGGWPQPQQGDVQRSESVKFGVRGRGMWRGSLVGTSEKQPRQDERRPSNDEVKGSLRSAVESMIAADQKPEGDTQAPSSQQPDSASGWGVSSEQQVEAATGAEDKEPEEEKPVASPIRASTPSKRRKSPIPVKEPEQQKPVVSPIRPSISRPSERRKSPIPAKEPEQQNPVASPIRPSTRDPTPIVVEELAEQKKDGSPKSAIRSHTPSTVKRSQVTGTKHCGDMLEDDEFKDCIIQIGGVVVDRVHKCILAHHSPVLRAKFLDQNEPLEQKDGGMVVVKVPDGYSPQLIHAMICYAYYGRVDPKVLADCALDLFRLAGEYGIKELQQCVGSHLSSEINKENVLTMAQMAQELSRSDLFADCARFVCDHAKELSASDEWKQMTRRAPMLINDLLVHAFITGKEGGGHI